MIRLIPTAIGIAEEDREVIFEKFRQGNVSSGQDNLTREYAGTGLGLSIVKEICRMLGGEVSVESQLGIGSIFTVMLPKETTPVQPEAKSDINHRVDQLNRGQTDLSLKPTSSQPVGEPAVPANPEESLSDSREVDIDAMADETNLSQHEPLKDDPQA
ncbi:MAG: ATP-binding protein [Pirellulales bacterium]|nr:ATP-binding protein [Pirellulales bacterium]